MKIGIIGGDFGLHVQNPIIKTDGEMNLIAVSTLKRHSLPEEFFKMDKPPNHSLNWKEMINNENLDLLLVSAIPPHHFEMVKYSLHKNINVICEKPFAMDSKESGELMRIQRKT